MALPDALFEDALFLIDLLFGVTTEVLLIFELFLTVVAGKLNELPASELE